MKILRRRWVVVLVGGTGLLLATVHGLHRLARSRTYQVFGRLVPRVETAERAVALTFDDGPTEAVIDDILAVLASRRVRATFFVTGADMVEAPGAARRLVAAGHELGNHTYSHERMIFRSQGFYRIEVERTDELIRAAGEQREIYFRMPYCWKLVGLPWFLWRTGRTTITWDVDPASNPKTTPEMIVARTLERVRPGSIILLHPWYASGPSARAALPLIIDKLRGEGYQFVTVDELLHINTRTVAVVNQP
jgi:peptidoglycan/xylan/chitin deacetylase (PgdA/CDA1 family)